MRSKHGFQKMHVNSNTKLSSLDWPTITTCTDGNSFYSAKPENKIHPTSYINLSLLNRSCCRGGMIDPLDCHIQLTRLDIAKPQTCVHHDLAIDVRDTTTGQEAIIAIWSHFPQLGLAWGELQSPFELRSWEKGLEVEEGMPHLVIRLEPVSIKHLLRKSLMRLNQLCFKEEKYGSSAEL